jgi:hypothetical protein
MYMSKRKIFPSTHSVFVLGKGKRKSHQFYCMVKLYDTLYAKLPMHVDSMIWCEQILCTTLFCFLLLYPYSKRVYIKLPLYLFYTSNIKSLILMWGSISYTFLFSYFLPRQLTQNPCKMGRGKWERGEGGGRLTLIHSCSKNSVHINFTTYKNIEI